MSPSEVASSSVRNADVRRVVCASLALIVSRLPGGCISIRACLLRFATGALDRILQFSRAALVLLSDLFELIVANHERLARHRGFLARFLRSSRASPRARSSHNLQAAPCWTSSFSRQLFFLLKESAVLLLEAFVMAFEVFSVPVELPELPSGAARLPAWVSVAVRSVASMSACRCSSATARTRSPVDAATSASELTAQCTHQAV